VAWGLEVWVAAGLAATGSHLTKLTRSAHAPQCPDLHDNHISVIMEARAEPRTGGSPC